MNYRNNVPGERTRALRRLWEIEVYEGNETPDEDTPTRTETVIAWNAVDAIRRSGSRAFAQPRSLGFVSWPVDGDDIFIVATPKIGPIGDPVETTIATPEEESWDF
jgi:hypothetical protein